MTLASSNYQFTYTPHYKPNQLICGYGQTAVITGWTVKQSVAKQLNPEDYAVIGNLYSPTRGISPLIRNLLANPHVRFLVILQATKEDKNAGGCQCLLDFLANGFTKGTSDTGRDTWVINSTITGYIDIEITADALETLRQSLDYKEVKSISEVVNYVKEFAKETHKQTWGEPLIFPIVETTPTVLPGPRYGHRIEGKTIAETWVKILHRIKTTGTIRPTGYDGKWQELIDLTAVITNEPPEFYFPDPNYLPIDRSFLQEYIPQILDDAPYTEGVKYTYGQRLRSWFKRDQIEQVINKLIGEIDAASGVMSLWDVNDHDKGGSPCLNHIWVRVVDNELSLTATLRSNDMFAAWPANAMGLRALQQHIRDAIAKRSDYNLQMGPLITISQSAHIYDDTWENVDKLISNQYAKIINNRDYFDPSGNFLIEVEDGQIMVKQTTSGSGEIVACYSGKNPLKLVRDICAASPAIQPDHIGYLGMELQKAYQSLKLGNRYTQDQ
ncbi:thymidylate synthase [Rippkaea orientalis PCC 8801]|uniref:Thymidylate synthase n=1 Tax=Rippkaea orientalis (strain PCC 8801 / RF-1) TaxID=41431 RepID=B7K3G9_RIPO1|nr:thymidylate synthase [Rippkaea orientalis]ACK65311.1 thymidylate synthase [Rippkaea orientalis PCC 8801]